jgi:benzodiazapine receptor
MHKSTAPNKARYNQGGCFLFQQFFPGGTMNKDTLRQTVTAAATLVTITVNGLANALPINGQNTGEISDRFDVYFTPAGYVFSIWGVIYLALIAFTVYQALPSQRENERLRAVAPLYWLASAANITWLFLWHYEVFPLTLVAMVTLLITLILIYLRLDIRRADASIGMRWLVHLPFSIYLGWITVATITNVSALLWLAGWGGFGISPEAWTAIVLAVAVGIAAANALTRADVAYLLVLVWAFVGIAAKHSTVPTVALSAGIAAGLVVLLALLSALPRGPVPLRR